MPTPLNPKDKSIFGDHWITNATRHKGALHRHLGIPESKTIPASRIKSAEHSSDATIRKEANLAETLKHLHHKGK